MDEWPRATLLSTLKYSTFNIYSTLYIPRGRCFPLNLVSMSYCCCDKTCNYLHDTHITPHPPPVHPVQSHWHLSSACACCCKWFTCSPFNPPHLSLCTQISTANSFFFPGFHFPAFATSFYPLQSDPLFTLFCSHFFSEYVFPSVLPTKELSGTHKNTVSETDRKNSSQHDQNFSHCLRHWQG